MNILLNRSAICLCDTVPGTVTSTWARQREHLNGGLFTYITRISTLSFSSVSTPLYFVFALHLSLRGSNNGIRVQGLPLYGDRTNRVEAVTSVASFPSPVSSKGFSARGCSLLYHLLSIAQVCSCSVLPRYNFRH